jgi:hypothetical protein
LFGDLLPLIVRLQGTDILATNINHPNVKNRLADYSGLKESYQEQERACAYSWRPAKNLTRL